MVGFRALRASSKSEGTRMVYCWRGEGCGQERARESKDDRLGSSSGSTTGVIRWCLGDEHREILGVLPLVV